MAESKKRTGTSIPRRMSDYFSVLSSTIREREKGTIFRLSSDGGCSKSRKIGNKALKK